MYSVELLLSFSQILQVVVGHVRVRTRSPSQRLIEERGCGGFNDGGDVDEEEDEQEYTCCSYICNTFIVILIVIIIIVISIHEFSFNGHAGI